MATWLESVLGDGVPTIAGIDHAFSFPLAYFERHSLARDWLAFLEDFVEHWPTGEEFVYVDSIRDGHTGRGGRRTGDPNWLRLTERWTSSAKSVFRFDGQGCVGKATHAGLPWLLHLKKRLRWSVHVWPFDGWDPKQGVSVLAEVYPSIWMKRVASGPRNSDQQAAYSTAAWLSRADRDGTLESLLSPPLTESEEAIAKLEGWILGVT